MTFNVYYSVQYKMGIMNTTKTNGSFLYTKVDNEGVLIKIGKKNHRF